MAGRVSIDSLVLPRRGKTWFTSIRLFACAQRLESGLLAAGVNRTNVADENCTPSSFLKAAELEQ
jgi:hypothetical protein